MTSCQRIKQLNRLLRSTDDDYHFAHQEAAALYKKCNYYYLSPIFLMFGGIRLQKNLGQKFNLQRNFTLTDAAMNIPTVLIFDAIAILLTILLAILLMSLVWLPNWQNRAYTYGYNKIDSDAFHYVCTETKYQQCQMCRQGIIAYETDTDKYEFELDTDIKCKNKIPTVDCPMVNLTGFIAVQTAIDLEKFDYYVDPNSFYDKTYIVYKTHGTKNNSSIWDAAMCNQVRQAEYARDFVSVKWIFSFLLILIMSGFFYCISAKLLKTSLRSYRFAQFASANTSVHW